jgi:hypothetical protein
MTTLEQVYSRISGAEIEADGFAVAALLSGTGLLISLIFASYGLDLSAALF